MHISTFDMSNEMRDKDFQEYLAEKRVRQDLEKLTVEDFIDNLLDTIDKDTTVDMIEQNIIAKGVTDIKDLQCLIISKTMTKDEVKNLYPLRSK